MHNKLSIPQAILDAAQADLHAAPVVAFLDEIKARQGVASDTNPPDLPDDVWAVIQELAAAHAGMPAHPILGIETSILGVLLSDEEKSALRALPADERLESATEILNSRYQ